MDAQGSRTADAARGTADMMMPGSKGQKAVHACMIRLLNADREATAFMSK